MGLCIRSKMGIREQRSGMLFVKKIFCLLALCTGLCVWPAVTAFCQDLVYPLGVVWSEQGDVFVADRNLPGIWKISDGQAVVFYQASKTFRTPMNAVRCLAIDQQGRLLAGDSATREIYRFDSAGKPEPLGQAVIGIPMDIAVSSSGDIYVADLEAHMIYVIPAAGGKPTEFLAVPAPRGLAIDKADNLWVASHGPNQVLRISPDKQQEVVVAGQPFQFSHQIRVDDAGTAYVADGYGKCLWKIIIGQKPEKLFEGEPLKNPVGIAIRGDRLLIADPHAKAILQASTTGGELSSLLKP